MSNLNLHVWLVNTTHTSVSTTTKTHPVRSKSSSLKLNHFGRNRSNITGNWNLNISQINVQSSLMHFKSSNCFIVCGLYLQTYSKFSLVQLQRNYLPVVTCKGNVLDRPRCKNWVQHEFIMLIIQLLAGQPVPRPGLQPINMEAGKNLYLGTKTWGKPARLRTRLLWRPCQRLHIVIFSTATWCQPCGVYTENTTH